MSALLKEAYIGGGPGRIVYKPQFEALPLLISADPVIEIITELWEVQAEDGVIRFPFQGQTLVYIPAPDQPTPFMLRLQRPD